MNNFVFQNPTKLIFGKGTIATLATEIPADKKILMTYGGGSIKANGVYDQVKEALKNHSVTEFAGIEPNPTYETLIKAVEIVKEQKIDFLLAVGGGSVIDGTKFIAAAVVYNGDPWDLLIDQNKITDALPLASVLTLPATGSEMNGNAVISKKATHEKLAFGSIKANPVFSILDPEVTYSLPKRQVANGIVDTFVHVCEQYLTYPSQAMVQDRFAEGILSTLTELGEKVIADNTNYDLMSNFMYSATLALNGFIAMGVPQDWATHSIGHELTAFHGLDHAVTLAIVQPSLWRVMREEKKAKLLQYGERVWNITTGSDDEKVEAAIAKTENFYRSVGIKTKLSEYGIGSESINSIVERFEQRGWKLGENGTITPDKVREILNGCL
ncbi:iron-containing alcohol dehydrogenase [Paludibacter jiangxiensis]|uniref:NADP-dependent alcohol dehydrogenase n=1 Tax=Paludibacter jiangxiensis TaxID=681398 RepID=A0A170YW26_9BACT|nr:iron-containing alcohol dehydrogenase [Paludibacter jiangxiensis]GAT62119.1 NADP-dependent alcohol dehydrogenase [Paludibacter jiangxiensis]